MNGSEQQRIVQSRRRRSMSGLAGGAVFLLAASLAAMALAAGGAQTVSSASNSKLGERIVVNAQGRTLYALSPETAGHLLCKSTECLKFWPPLTVSSRKVKLKAGPGVHGKLGLLRRGKTLQVTLRGMPLYRFAGDSAKSQTNGEGLKSFGGTWHAVTAAASSGKGPTTTTTSSSSTTNAYGEPEQYGVSSTSSTTAASTSSTQSTQSTQSTPTTTTTTTTTTTSSYTYAY
jgi:predicted lipoprotein with Yx(FWY)xxD motif